MNKIKSWWKKLKCWKKIGILTLFVAVILFAILLTLFVSSFEMVRCKCEGVSISEVEQGEYDQIKLHHKLRGIYQGYYNIDNDFKESRIEYLLAPKNISLKEYYENNRYLDELLLVLENGKLIFCGCFK